MYEINCLCTFTCKCVVVPVQDYEAQRCLPCIALYRSLCSLVLLTSLAGMTMLTQKTLSSMTSTSWINAGMVTL